MDRDRQRNILFAVAGLGVAGLVIALVVIFATGGTTKDAESGSDAVRAQGDDGGRLHIRQQGAAAAEAGRSERLPPRRADAHDQGQMEHVPALGRLALPAVGGLGLLHAARQPASGVHNLEHGGVVLWWGPDVPESTISELRSFYNESPTGMFGTPIAGLGNKVAISAWTGDPARYYRNGYHGIGHLAVCPGFDKHAFTVFRDAYRGHGPEGVPLEADQEGSGP